MGHHITALIAVGAAYDCVAREFGTMVVELDQGFVMVPLDASQSDFWCELMGLPYGHDKPIILDGKFAHYLAKRVFESKTYAIINTDYNGGLGTQAAVVYSAGEEIMPTEVSPVQRVKRRSNLPINKALRLLGAERRTDNDEFQTVGISNYRYFDDLFEPFWEDV